MSTKWIDYDELRQKLDFATVLQHYGVELKLKSNGKQHHGFCPLPTHDGKKRSPSFSAKLTEGIWNCFGCGAKGNVLHFAVRMEACTQMNGSEFRKAALKVQETFLPGTVQRPPAESKKHRKPERAPAPASESGRVEVNAPLDFELKGLDPDHPYLLARGFAPETIGHFGLGYCKRGSVAERVAIPLHNAEGKLVGYAGRVVDDAAINEQTPKYKFPSKRDHNGVTYEFRKSELVYNLHRIERPVAALTVVEGFPSVFWLHQAGVQNVVALMGSSCSDVQAERIVELVASHGHVWVFPDGDDAGSRFAQSVFERIAPHRSVRLLKPPPGKQPTDYNPEDLVILRETAPDSQHVGETP